MALFASRLPNVIQMSSDDEYSNNPPLQSDATPPVQAATETLQDTPPNPLEQTQKKKPPHTQAKTPPDEVYLKVDQHQYSGACQYFVADAAENISLRDPNTNEEIFVIEKGQQLRVHCPVSQKDDGSWAHVDAFFDTLGTIVSGYAQLSDKKNKHFFVQEIRF